ncbi:MAG TPA: LUD domain-containing protein [Thermomicrobiales bacterium]|nr:LUD domain-containing protein [Thermomicrobiales bacterium]
MTDSSFGNLYDRFSQRLGTAGGHTHQMTGTGELASAIDTLHPTTGPEPRVVWIAGETATLAPELLDALRARGLEPRVSTGPAEVRDQPLGLAIARATIAETGSSLMVEPTVEGRSVTLMTDILIVLCESDQLVPSLMEAAPILRDVSRDGASYATFITGPSRTADIERTLAVGVQGPGVFHVIFTDRIA